MNKILVIEDELDIRELIEQTLLIEGFEVVVTENGRAGVEKAKEILPDLIISDVNMPELDGFGVIKEIRNDKKTSSIPIILLTARSEKTDFREGMNLGADDYLSKPFLIDDLISSINTRLAKSKIIKEKESDLIDDLRLKISLSLPHELRTPLFGIIGFAEMFVNDYDSLSRQEFVEMSRIILENAHRLNKTIEKYLLYTHLLFLRNNRNKILLLRDSKCQITDDYVKKCLEEKIGEVKREGDLQINVDPCFLKIHKDYLTILIDQVGSNCFSYSDAGTSISIRGKAVGNNYLLSFEDKGRGMTKEQIENIGAFNQFDRNIYEQQGAGMGLAISKIILDLFDNSIELKSEPKKGTIAQLSLSVLS